MIKKFSVLLLLSGLLMVNSSSFCSGPKPYNKKSQKEKDEEIHNSPTSPVAKGAAPQSVPTIVLPQMAQIKSTPAVSATQSIPSPVSTKTSTQTPTPAAEKALKLVTLHELIKRQQSMLSILSASASKKLFGADVVILGALAGLKKAEESLDCRDAGTQAQLGSAVEAIIKEKNLANAEELLRLSQINEIFLDKTYREKLREFVSKCQKEKEDTFQAEYNKECNAIKEKLKRHIAESRKFDGLIDSTYQLGGKRNLTEDELAFLQGDKSKLTKEQQQALAKKQTERMRAGLSDNEEEHPEYVDPQTIIKVPASQLSALKPGPKSLKAKAEPATALAKK